MKEYNDCYFAFIDLLGFKEIIKSRACSEIVDIFDEVKKRYVVNRVVDKNIEIPVIPPDDIHLHIMSDSVCVFIKSDIEYALPILTWLCMNFQVRMLCLKDPVFVRGSISKGEIYEDRNVLFGPAMVEAYLRGEKVAKVPRIILPVHLYDEVIEKDEKAMLDGFMYMESDGFYTTRYIDWFCHHKTTIEHRENVKKYIRSILDHSFDPSVREKYLYVKSWMDYYMKDKAKDNLDNRWTNTSRATDKDDTGSPNVIGAKSPRRRLMRSCSAEH